MMAYWTTRPAVGVCLNVDCGEPVSPPVDHLLATHHTHHSADASRDSSSAGPTPKRSATGAPAAIERFSSVVKNLELGFRCDGVGQPLFFGAENVTSGGFLVDSARHLN